MQHGFNPDGGDPDPSTPTPTLTLTLSLNPTVRTSPPVLLIVGSDGMEYHPVKADNHSSRMLYSTSIRCSNIPASRVEDAAFW